MSLLHDSIVVYPIGKVSEDDVTTIIDLRVWRETDKVYDIPFRCSGSNFQENILHDVEFLLDNVTVVKKEKIKYIPEKCLLRVSINKAEELKLQNGRSKKLLKVIVYDSGSKKALFESEKFIRRKTQVKRPTKIQSSMTCDTVSTITDESSLIYDQDDNETQDSLQWNFSTSTPDVLLQTSSLADNSSVLNMKLNEKSKECDINIYKYPIMQPSVEYVFDERIWNKFPEHPIKLQIVNTVIPCNNFKIEIIQRDINQNEFLLTKIYNEDTVYDKEWIEIYLRMNEEKQLQTIDSEQFKIEIVDESDRVILESNWFERRKFMPFDDTASEDMSLSSLQSIDERNMQEQCYAFTLIITQEEIPNTIKLDKYIYLEPIEPKYPSNHAFRTFIRKHDVKFVASFKIDNRLNEKSQDKDIDREIISKKLFTLLDDGIETLIDTGTEKLQVKFLYFGHSSSGMREGNFWAVDSFCVKKSDIEAFIKGLGEFSDLESPEKLCKRYGQSFSTSFETVQIKKNEYICVQDDTCKDDNGEVYEITDGIGMMRMSVAREMSEKLGLNYLCNVFQIRCAGFKGVLSAWPNDIFDAHLAQLETNRNTNSIKVIFRKSQKKFKFSSEFITINAVNWMAFSLPPAALNSEFLMILDGCDDSPNGRIRKPIIKLYEDSLNDIEESMIDSAKALSKLSAIKQNEFTAKFMNILLACGKNFKESLDSETSELIQGLIVNQTIIPSIIKRKLNIVVEKSRYLIGIIDETDLLEEDEVFVSYRDSSDCLNYLNEVPVIVSRNPCYALGEIRRVITRDVPELRHLENVIVFSKQGKRPLPNMLSGGDLDGDLYFVSWDERLTDFKNAEPLLYPKSKAEGKIASNNLRNEIINTFVKSVLSNSSIGLWHYYLLSMYDSNRANMRLDEYKKGVYNINKCIDGLLVTDEPPNVRPPSWYLTRKALKDISFSENKLELAKLKTRIDALLKLIDQYKLIDKSKGERDSLVGQLMYKTFEKYYRIVNLIKCAKTDTSFFTQTDINILQRDNKINLSYVDDEFDDIMFGAIKKAHVEYLHKLKHLEKTKGKSRKPSNTPELFAGAAEKSLNGKNNSFLELQKATLKKEFRDYVFNFKYKIENSIDDITLIQVIHNDLGIFACSRIVKLYLTCLRKKENYMYLAWEFYDILCFLKNYSNCKQSQSFNSYIYLSLPFTVPIDAFGTICNSVTRKLYSLKIKVESENENDNNKAF